jgi:hypothetical protein
MGGEFQSLLIEGRLFRMAVFQTHTKNNPNIWLDFIDYSNRLFNQSNQNIWSNPVAFLSVFGQGQSLLRSDVISLSMLPFYSNWLNEHPEEIDALKGKKLKVILKRIFSLDSPKQNIQEVLKGICHSYKDIKPIAFFIPSPQLWLMEAARLTDSDLSLIDENLVDTASMYLADLLRNFSEAGLSAVVIKEASEPILSPELIVGLYQPIVNIALHYQWKIGYWVMNNEILHSFPDFYLSPSNDMPLEKSVFMLNESWWAECFDDAFIPEVDMIFGKISRDTIPELVLTKLKGIRMTTKSS